MSLACVIVDDSAEFRRSAARLLEAEGIKVVGQCRSGREAVGVVGAVKPDVVLVDVELGDEDGVDVAAELARCAPSAVVILISSRDQGELRESLERGSPTAVRYLPKESLSAAAISRLMD